MRIIAHRGAPREAPENTIAAFEAAAKRGADALEIDLCLTADEELALWHDCDPDEPVALARQLGLEPTPYRPVTPPAGDPMRRPVCELTLAELREHYGYAHLSGPLPQASIPTLDEVLCWLDTPVAAGIEAMYLDLKHTSGRPGQARRAFDLIAAKIARKPGLEQLQFFALTPHEDSVQALLEARRQRPTAARLSVIWDHEEPGALEHSEALGLRHLCIGTTPLRSFGEALEEARLAVEARRRGRIDEVVFWTIDDEERATTLHQIGVDGIMTNVPLLVGEVRRRASVKADSRVGASAR